MQPFEVVQKLTATNSRLDKERIIEEAWNAGCYDFFDGVRLCYDGLISFGVKQIPDRPDRELIGWCEPNAMHNDFLKLTTQLSKRELSGHAARDAIQDFSACVPDYVWNKWFKRILLKDLDVGLSESTTNKVLKKIGGKATEYMVKEFPYQRCCLPKDAKMDKFSWKTGVSSQLKSDGMFVNVNHYSDGSVDMLSRSGKPFPQEQFQNMIDDIKQSFKKDTQTHGELLVYKSISEPHNGVVAYSTKELPREIGNGILNSVAQGGVFEDGCYPVYVTWDQIPLSSVVSKGSYIVPYETRIVELTRQLEDANSSSLNIVKNKVVYNIEEAIDHYKELIALGYEGTIIKEPTAIWKDGTSKFQVKLKLEADCDLEIVGFNPGNGKNALTFGSILCKTSDGLLEVNVSGFKDDQRLQIWENRDMLVGTIMTVRSNCLMKPSATNGVHSLFLPRFLEFRRDKTEADSLQKVKDQFESALK